MPAAAILLILLLGVPLPAAFATAPLAEIELPQVSGRTITYGGNPVMNTKASGLHNVAIKSKVYLEAEVTTTTVLSGYKWFFTSKPAGSVAALSATTGTLITFTPDKVGAYNIALVPRLNSKDTTAVVQLIRAAKFIGAGKPDTAGANPATPHCSARYCHGGANARPELNVSPEWVQSKHALKLQNTMNGVYGGFYKTSCLPCHTVGYDSTLPLNGDGGFEDVAAAMGYNLSQIPTLVAESAAQVLPKFDQLPATLQGMSGIQCESCHGPGSQHPSLLGEPDHGIAGTDLHVDQCAQCHDAPNHHQVYWQWESGPHPNTHELEDGHVVASASCVRCHSGDGFVAQQVKGGASGKTYPNFEDTLGATCVVCHDPHYTTHTAQLRIGAGTYKYDNGDVYPGVLGAGETCIHCHQGRVAAGQTTRVSSWRGIHGAAQSDMLAGLHGYTWNLATSSSAHRTVVPDSCVTCHMAEPTRDDVPTPPKVGGHTCMMVDDMGTTDTADDVENVEHACGECHSGLDTYDRPAAADYDGDTTIAGIQTEVHGLMTILRTKILALNTSATLDAATGKILPVRSATATSGDYLTTTYNKFSTNTKGAIYNYNFVVSDGSYGIHNAAYTVQLLQRSYQYLTGHSITADYPNVVLRTNAPSNAPVPVEMSGFIVQ